MNEPERIESTTLDGVEVRLRTVRANDVSLCVAEAGPSEGPPVVLLHGFPEFWLGWRHQIPALARHGFRVIAPDQRGYDLSEKPRGASNYGVDVLANDVAGLMSELGCGRDTTIVGHDWGAVVAWWLGLTRAERFGRLVILNVPHPEVFRRHVRRSLRQMLRSWYILFFQLPWLPEWSLRRRNFRMLVKALETSRPGTFSDEDLARYRTAWSRPGALTAMVNWYRAMVRHAPRLEDPTVRVPTRIVWGCLDRFLGREMVEPSARFCESVEVLELERATHWVQHEEPDFVNRVIIEFAGSPPTGEANH